MVVSKLCSQNFGSERDGASRAALRLPKGKPLMGFKTLAAKSDWPYRILRNTLLSTLLVAMLLPDLAVGATQSSKPLDFESLCCTAAELKNFKDLLSKHMHYDDCPAFLRPPNESVLSAADQAKILEWLQGDYQGPDRYRAKVTIKGNHIQCKTRHLRTRNGIIRMSSQFELKAITNLNSGKTKYALWVCEPSKLNIYEHHVAPLRTDSRSVSPGKTVIEPALLFYNREKEVSENLKGWCYVRQNEAPPALIKPLGATSSASEMSPTQKSDTDTRSSHADPENGPETVNSLHTFEVPRFKPWTKEDASASSDTQLIYELPEEHISPADVLVKYAKFIKYFESAVQDGDKLPETDDDRLRFLIGQAHLDPSPKKPLQELLSKLDDRHNNTGHRNEFMKSEQLKEAEIPKQKQIRNTIKYLMKEIPAYEYEIFEKTAPKALDPVEANFRTVGHENIYKELTITERVAKRLAKQSSRTLSRNQDLREKRKQLAASCENAAPARMWKRTQCHVKYQHKNNFKNEKPGPLFVETKER